MNSKRKGKSKSPKSKRQKMNKEIELSIEQSSSNPIIEQVIPKESKNQLFAHETLEAITTEPLEKRTTSKNDESDTSLTTKEFIPTRSKGDIQFSQSLSRFQPSRMAKAKDFEVNYQEIQDDGYYEFSQLDDVIESSFAEDSIVSLVNVDNPHVDILSNGFYCLRFLRLQAMEPLDCFTEGPFAPVAGVTAKKLEESFFPLNELDSLCSSEVDEWCRSVIINGT